MTSFVQALFSRPVGRTPRGLTSFLVFAVLSMVCAPAFAATATDLGSNDPFAIVSETYSNSTAATSINGDVCYTTGPAANPTISGITEVPCDDQKGIDQNNALADLNAQNCEPLGAAVALDTVSINGGTPGEFPPGCYSSTGAMSITTGGTVSLTGSGVYIFRPDGALDAGADSEVVMTAAGACENDVYWTPTGGTTVGANSAFVGNIFRGTADGLSVTLGDSASLTGRILAFGSTVTTDNNTITVPTCQGIPPAITLTKTITGGDPYSTEGDTITYSLVAENTGSVTLTDVTISDPDVTLSNCVPAQGATLDPAETISCDGSYTVSQADVDAGSFLNTATVVGTDPQSETVNNTDSARATATATVAPVSVSALSGWAMITLAMFLAIFGLTVVFRQQG
ncbi:MAG: ice-binding family protein [Xanthomonadales bacterium]|nr:ice-binding family protein [Xanthomonadales bacterium]